MTSPTFLSPFSREALARELSASFHSFYRYNDEGDFVWGMSESGTITVEKVNEGV